MKPWTLSLAGLLFLAACNDRTDHPVNGTWVVSQEVRGETHEITFDFQAHGSRLEGTIRAAKSIAITDGTIQGNVISFDQAVSLQDGSQETATYKGTIRGNEIEFTITLLGESRLTVTRVQ